MPPSPCSGAFLRINFLVTLIALAMGTPWMLYYICALHTFWTAVVSADELMIASEQCMFYVMTKCDAVIATRNDILSY